MKTAVRVPNKFRGSRPAKRRPPQRTFTGVPITATFADTSRKSITVDFTYPDKMERFWTEAWRYKVVHGGRGSAKSWTIARMLILHAVTSKVKILCAREIQNTIKDSVHAILKEQIEALGFSDRFYITDNSIRCLTTGSEFFFRGLRGNASEIKSIEGIDFVWIEEAEKVSKDSWEYLTPTIRKPNSEIWVSFNPEDEKAHTYTWFCQDPPPNALVIEMNYSDNPWFGDPLKTEMEYDKQRDPDKYQHVWLGKPKKYAKALIFGDRIHREDFNTPENSKFYLGVDFGFSTDPTSLIRMFLQPIPHGSYGMADGPRKCKENCKFRHVGLFIDYEAYGHGVELNELHQFFSTVPHSHKWKITAESARPDTISFLRKKSPDGTVQPYNMVAAEKGAGSVEDGIQFLRGFDAIVVHTRCPGTWGDFSNYKWKVDKITQEIQPIPVDASNHSCDAARYGLEKYIKSKTTIWEVLGS